MSAIELMQDASEVVHYECAGIPLYIRTGNLTAYPDMKAPCHWHDDIEWIHITKGKMNYYINGTRILLNENDCIMVNARQMHYGYSFQGQDCNYSCILFHPALFSGNKILLQNYITPVLENSDLEYLYFNSKNEFGKEVADLLEQMVSVKDHAPDGYEIETIGIMHMLWSRLWRHMDLLHNDITGKSHTDLEIQKNMVSYIYQHYAEKIALSDIAASGHVSRSKCCIIFKRYLQQSPIDFLNAYRLKVSSNLLVNTHQNISDIALSCGFNHLSYFSKMFYNRYGCTPKEYRKHRSAQ